MGIFNALMGISNDATAGGSMVNCADGGHSIDKAKVLGATDAMALTPKNPGNFQSIRSIPVLTQPRYFSQEEAQVLTERARQAKEGVTHTKKAVKALAKIDTCDRKVNNLYYRKYAPVIASNELSKKRAQVSYGKHLHGQRAGYAALGAGLQEAENRAEIAINKIAATLG